MDNCFVASPDKKGTAKLIRANFLPKFCLVDKFNKFNPVETWERIKQEQGISGDYLFTEFFCEIVRTIIDRNGNEIKIIKWIPFSANDIVAVSKENFICGDVYTETHYEMKNSCGDIVRSTKLSSETPLDKSIRGMIEIGTDTLFCTEKGYYRQSYAGERYLNPENGAIILEKDLTKKLIVNDYILDDDDGHIASYEIVDDSSIDGWIQVGTLIPW